MAEKIIQVSSATIEGEGNRMWVKVSDENLKTHPIFRSVTKANRSRIDLSKEVDELVSQISAGTIQGKRIGITKEQVGQYWNVVAVNFNPETPIPPSEAPQDKKKAVEKEMPFTGQKEPIAPQERGMWYKELGELIRWSGLPKETDFGKAVRVKYLAEMMRVLGTLDKNVVIECLKTWGITAKDLGDKE